MHVRALASAFGLPHGRKGAAVVDAALASALLAVAGRGLTTWNRGSPGLAVACCVVMAGAVALRRRRPMLAALAALIGLVGYELVTRDPNLASPPVAVVLTSYTLGRWGTPRRPLVPVVANAALSLLAIVVVSAQLQSSVATTMSSWLVADVAPLAAGLMLARRNRLSQQLADAAEQLRTEQECNAERAAVDERTRVARDLHDVVAHCVSVMVVQAGAARLIAAHDPAESDRALSVIGDCGREAMADLRRIVGVLRHSDDPGYGRGAGLSDLGRLIRRIEAAGVKTELRIHGGTTVPPAIDVVAFRVVQEALTNVVKHGGQGATAVVEVSIDAAAVIVEVSNNRASPSVEFTRSGHGLVGMRERIGNYGGELRAGRLPDGGYRVRASIPVSPLDPRAVTTAAARGLGNAMRPAELISPRVATAVTVAFWLAVMEVEAATSSARHGPWLLNAAAVAAMAGAAGWRRRSPLMFLAIVGTFSIALGGGLTSLDRSTATGLYGLAVPLFTVAAWEPRARATVGLALWTAGASGVAAVHRTAVGGLAGALVMAVVVWVAGRVWRTQSLLNAELSDTLARLALEQNQRAELAMAAERSRIARDLHGPVAHGVIAMVVRAEAARKLLVHDPGQTGAAILDIEQMGREALVQLRRILGVLRSNAEPPTADLGSEDSPTPAILFAAQNESISERVTA